MASVLSESFAFCLRVIDSSGTIKFGRRFSLSVFYLHRCVEAADTAVLLQLAIRASSFCFFLSSAF